MAKIIHPIVLSQRRIGSKKIIVTHPATGTERKFDASIYEPVKAAILQSLKGSRGKHY